VTETIPTLEYEVEEARAKLASDLRVLQSPQVLRDFSTHLRSEAQSVVQRLFDDLKGRAAANPTAALAIGAGIGWRLFKHPPIATALIGVGILGLWRTAPMRVADDEYLATAQRRFGEQLSEAADTVADYAAETAVAARERVSAYAEAALNTAEEVTASATKQAAEVLKDARKGAADFSDRASSAFQRTTPKAIDDDWVRDQVLLGLAGAAVVAALGFAYQRHTGRDFGG
jgi:hypothetical protein